MSILRRSKTTNFGQINAAVFRFLFLAATLGTFSVLIVESPREPRFVSVPIRLASKAGLAEASTSLAGLAQAKVKDFLFRALHAC